LAQNEKSEGSSGDAYYRRGLLIVTAMQMNLSRSWLAIGSLALCVASPAGAQENLDKNKTGAQLYASICADCHKSPQGLKPTGIFGLESFLREHYTADRESAAAIATYLKGLKPVASQRGRAAKRTTSQAKPSQPKPSDSANKPRPPADIPRP
jgi:mono/diheme cytochrome c family protein